jgi:hypothetical protein
MAGCGLIGKANVKMSNQIDNNRQIGFLKKYQGIHGLVLFIAGGIVVFYLRAPIAYFGLAGAIAGVLMMMSTNDL